MEGRRLHVDADQRLAKLRGINSIYVNGSKDIDICRRMTRVLSLKIH